MYSADINTEINEITNDVTKEYSKPSVPTRGRNDNTTDIMLITAMHINTFLVSRI